MAVRGKVTDFPALALSLIVVAVTPQPLPDVTKVSIRSHRNQVIINRKSDLLQGRLMVARGRVRYKLASYKVAK